VTLPKKEGSLAAEPSPFVSESANGFFSFFVPGRRKSSARVAFFALLRRAA
jgi:hypothetical protein